MSVSGVDEGAGMVPDHGRGSEGVTAAEISRWEISA